MLIDNIFLGNIDDSRREVMGDIGIANITIAEAKAALIKALVTNPIGNEHKFFIKVEVEKKDESC